MSLNKLPEDVINHKVSEYLSVLDLYRGRNSNSYWDVLFRERLADWSVTGEPWILAATNGDTDLMRLLLDANSNMRLPRIIYSDTEDINALINIALDNHNEDITEMVMDACLKSTSHLSIDEGLMRMASTSDEWARIFFERKKDLYDSWTIRNILSLSKDKREFLQTIERGFKLNILDEKWALESLSYIRGIGEYVTQRGLLGVYNKYVKRYDFYRVEEDLRSAYRDRRDVSFGIRNPKFIG